MAYSNRWLLDAADWRCIAMRSHRIKLNQDMKSIYTVAALASLAVLASCSSTTKTRAPQPQRLPQPAQASTPKTVAAPSNIDNMVYKERGTVIFTTGRSSGDGSYYSANGGGEGAHFGAPGGSWGISYQKTGAKKATIGRWSGHSTSSTYLQFTTPTSGYVYRREMESRGNESVSNERIPFTLEHL